MCWQALCRVAARHQGHLQVIDHNLALLAWPIFAIHQLLDLHPHSTLSSCQKYGIQYFKKYSKECHIQVYASKLKCDFAWSLFYRVYLWHDDKGKKITKTNVSAPQYIDYVMTCCHKYLHDDAVFPTKYGKSKECVAFGYVQTGW